MTVTGYIEAEQLGFIPMHDHLLAYLTPFFKAKLPPETHSSCSIDTETVITIDNLAYFNELGLRSYCSDNWDLSNVELMTKEAEWFKPRGVN